MKNLQLLRSYGNINYPYPYNAATGFPFSAPSSQGIIGPRIIWSASKITTQSTFCASLLCLSQWRTPAGLLIAGYLSKQANINTITCCKEKL